MNSVQDAYEPPIELPKKRLHWVRWTLMLFLLIIVAGAMTLESQRLQKQAAMDRYMDTRGIISPNPIPDGSGATIQGSETNPGSATVQE